MKTNLRKTLLISAMATAFMTPHAMAEDVMKFYGQANISIDNSDANGPGRTEGTELKSNASRIGMMGSLDTTLENTQLIYKMEIEYKTVGNNGDGAGPGDDSNQIYAREAFTGLKNKQYGKIRLGRFTTGYKSSYTKIDPWTDHVLQARQSGQQGASNLNANYFNYAVDYTTPKFNGFQLNAHYSFLGDNSDDALHNSGKLKDLTGGSASGFGVKYNHEGLRLTADYMNIDSDNDPGATNPTKAHNGSAHKITAQYKMGSGTTFAGLYEDVTDINLGENIWAIVKQKVGKNGMVSLSYGINRASEDNAYHKTEDAKTLGLGAKYKLTKKSALIAGFSSFDRGGEEVKTFTLGIDAKFGY